MGWEQEERRLRGDSIGRREIAWRCLAFGTFLHVRFLFAFLSLDGMSASGTPPLVLCVLV